MEPLTLYVATDGNDAWSGTRADPVADRSDGPFATLTKARDAIRERKGRDGLAQPITVLVRGGKYYLEQPLVLRAEGSGTYECPITYAAYPGEQPIISGGIKIDGWRPYKGQIIQATFPAGRGNKSRFRQLFFDGQRQVRARWPNRDPDNPLYGGWAFMEGPAEEGKEDGAPSYGVLPGAFDERSALAFRYRPGTFERRWEKPTEAEVYVCAGKYGSYTLPIKSIDWENRIITVAQTGRQFDRYPNFLPVPFFRNDRFVVENVLEELDQPGEWCLDSAEGTLYFWPPTGAGAGGAVVMPVLDCLVKLDQAAWVNIVGFIFTETTTGDNMHREGLEGYGAMFPLPGRSYCGEALHLRGAEHCRIEGNHFAAVGGNAIYLEDYNARNVITNNEISHAGHNGICLLGSKYFNPVPRHPLFNRIEDNYIHHCGVFDHYSTGVFLGLSQGNVVGHNRIEHLPHNAINLGNSGFGRNIVEYNAIRHVALEISDTAAINSWMEDPAGHTEKGAERSGHLIRHNLITDVRGCVVDSDCSLVPNPDGVHGIYLDNFTSNCFVYGNILVRCGYAIAVNMGKNNVIENNLVVDCNYGIRYSAFHGYAPQMYGFTLGNRFTRNIVYRANAEGHMYLLYDRVGELPLDQVIGQSDHNLFFDPAGGSYTIETRVGRGRDSTAVDTKVYGLAEWRRWGFETNSLIGDPLFVDREHGDYRLRPGSPALALGFLPTDVGKIGPRREAFSATENTE